MPVTLHVAGEWYSVPELSLRDHHFTVPLDYSVPQSPKITVFAREAVAVGKENKDWPYLLYLQGGPGFEAPRPTESSGWLKKACEEHRVILMDQRGTGLSTPLTTSSMLQFKSAQELVDYMKYFRADNIVNDAEFVRKNLGNPSEDAAPWKVLGQSFGGFCGVTYLSFAPQGLKEVYLTGGIPPIGDGCTAESVYNACIDPIVTQNEKYYKRYPQDIQIIHDVVNHLAESEGGGVPLPSGGILTPRGLQLLGLTGLGSSSGFEHLHYLFERVWDPILVAGSKKQISYYFLNAFESWLSFDSNPLYALMHESIYCQGAASRWAAHKVREEHESKFDAIKAAKEGRPVFLTGEMVFPWMFDEIHALKPFKEAANLLAEKEDWPPLYNKTALNNNKVPVAAAVYYEDMFVNFNLVTETAKQIAGIRLWVTNEYMHSGLRDGADHVLDHLMQMLNGVARWTCRLGLSIIVENTMLFSRRNSI
ncbi:Alpha/beta hydrolase fold-1 [Artemisia annua]|uniref:Alpha/beta hydrolase fold-1 n=1 Tax=Artemisia annua TaxID=35608 RepID=A0A2U1N8P8_ARTAN|nr:Alpha/beta hydrolase fold-1 [Artemisia annua]